MSQMITVNTRIQNAYDYREYLQSQGIIILKEWQEDSNRIFVVNSPPPGYSYDIKATAPSAQETSAVKQQQEFRQAALASGTGMSTREGESYTKGSTTPTQMTSPFKPSVMQSSLMQQPTNQPFKESAYQNPFGVTPQPLQPQSQAQMTQPSTMESGLWSMKKTINEPSRKMTGEESQFTGPAAGTISIFTNAPGEIYGMVGKAGQETTYTYGLWSGKRTISEPAGKLNIVSAGASYAIMTGLGMATGMGEWVMETPSRPVTETIAGFAGMAAVGLVTGRLVKGTFKLTSKPPVEFIDYSRVYSETGQPSFTGESVGRAVVGKGGKAKAYDFSSIQSGELTELTPKQAKGEAYAVGRIAKEGKKASMKSEAYVKSMVFKQEEPITPETFRAYSSAEVISKKPKQSFIQSQSLIQKTGEKVYPEPVEIGAGMMESKAYYQSLSKAVSITEDNRIARLFGIGKSEVIALQQNTETPIAYVKAGEPKPMKPLELKPLEMERAAKTGIAESAKKSAIEPIVREAYLQEQPTGMELSMPSLIFPKKRVSGYVGTANEYDTEVYVRYPEGEPSFINIERTTTTPGIPEFQTAYPKLNDMVSIQSRAGMNLRMNIESELNKQRPKTGVDLSMNFASVTDQESAMGLLKMQKNMVKQATIQKIGYNIGMFQFPRPIISRTPILILPFEGERPRKPTFKIKSNLNLKGIYTPSLAGIASGMTIRKPVKGTLTGLEPRFPVYKRK